MKRVLLLLAMSLYASFSAAQGDPAQELAHRSGLPASEVDEMLKNCDASQTSMNFCAWRDQIVAEQRLQLAIAKRVTDSPRCRTAIEKKVTQWKVARDRVCKKSATKEWGSGSMRTAAESICVTAETKRMTTRIGRTQCPR